MANNLITRIKTTNVNVIQGDITQIPTDAIMTAINSGGMWFGGVDGAIQRAAEEHYHEQAAALMPLKELQTVVAKGDYHNHSGQFNDVVFVVDDLKHSLDEVVYAGLEAAHNEGYKTLLVPAMRMGVMAGAVEKTPMETVGKIREGVEDFLNKYNGNTDLENLTFVIYRDPATIKQIEQGFK